MKSSQYIKTFVMATVVLFFTLQKGSGFVLSLLLPFFLAFVIYNGIRVIRRPGERKSRGIRLATWSMTLALAGTVQIRRGIASQKDAEIAVRKVLAFKHSEGSYPASLREIGLDDKYSKERGLRYSVENGKPALSYPATFMPLTVIEYDFEKSKWLKNAY